MNSNKYIINVYLPAPNDTLRDNKYEKTRSDEDVSVKEIMIEEVFENQDNSRNCFVTLLNFIRVLFNKI